MAEEYQPGSLPYNIATGAASQPNMPISQMADTAEAPNIQGLGGQAPSLGTVQGPAQPTVENPSQSVAQHIMSALGGGTGNPMDWAKGIVAGGLAGAANVGKQPEGAGWLHGAAQGAQGILEQRRQQALDLQKQQQIQFEQQQQQKDMQLKEQQNARAQKELENSTDRTKAEIAMTNANRLASESATKRAEELFPTLKEEAQQKVRESQLNIVKSEGEINSVVDRYLRDTTGKGLDQFPLIKDSSELTTDHAKQAGSGSIFPVSNGEQYKHMVEDDRGIYLVPREIWEGKIQQPETITTGDDKQTTAQTGTKIGDLYATALGYQKSHEDKIKDAITQDQHAHIQAETRNANAEASLHETQAKQAKEGAGEGAGNIVDEIGRGQMIPERIGYMLGRKDGRELLSQVAQKYPDIDMTKLQKYPEVSKEFASTKPNTAGFAINSGATALKHLQNLQKLNTPWSHVAHTPAWTAYRNQLDTLAPELAKFYGDTTIPAIASIKETLGSTLPGNRDKAITTQAQSMSKKMDSYEQQWKSAIPSPNWTTPMPNMDEEAKEARAALDPEYKQRLVQEHGARQPGQPMFASAPGKPRLMSNDGGKTWQPASTAQ